MLVAITGVSGSGKSTLVHDVIYKALEAKRTGGKFQELCDRIEGDQQLQSVVLVDQSPIGRTPRSNPSTYLKAFDAIREAFASTPEAKKRGYTAGHFSFNIPGGRCEACQGDGIVTVEMQFLADVELICEECRGTRFKSGVLEVRYREKNVHEVLQLTVREALVFFAGVPKITSQAENSRRSGTRLPAPGAIRDDAFRRRGATPEARRASHHAGKRGRLVYLRRTHDRPAFRRYSEAADGVPQADRRRRVDSGDRAQSRHHQIRGLDHRSGAGRRGAGRADRRHRNARAGGAQFAFVHGEISCARACKFPLKS